MNTFNLYSKLLHYLFGRSKFLERFEFNCAKKLEFSLANCNLS